MTTIKQNNVTNFLLVINNNFVIDNNIDHMIFGIADYPQST